jgi:hypothetical protein
MEIFDHGLAGFSVCPLVSKVFLVLCVNSGLAMIDTRHIAYNITKGVAASALYQLGGPSS